MWLAFVDPVDAVSTPCMLSCSSRVGFAMRAVAIVLGLRFVDVNRSWRSILRLHGTFVAGKWRDAPDGANLSITFCNMGVSHDTSCRSTPGCWRCSWMASIIGRQLSSDAAAPLSYSDCSDASEWTSLSSISLWSLKLPCKGEQRKTMSRMPASFNHKWLVWISTMLN